MERKYNKILVSLLAKQGMSDFYPLEKPNGSKIESQLYGYIKEDRFCVCDENLNQINRNDLKLPTESLLVACNDETYTLSDVVTENCFIISSENKVLVRNPHDYAKIATECFILGKIIELGEEYSGVVFDCEKYIKDSQSKSLGLFFSRPELYKREINSESNGWCSYSEDYRITLPNLNVDTEVYIDDVHVKDCVYLFSSNDYSFFFKTQDKAFLVYHNWQYRFNALELKPNCIWINDDGIEIVTSKLVLENEGDECGSIMEIRTLKGNCQQISIVDSDGYSSQISKYHKNHRIVATKHFLLMVTDVGSYNVPEALFQILNSEGKVCFSQKRNYAEWNFHNNILMIRELEQDTKWYYDCHGNIIAKGNRFGDEYLVAEQASINLPYYNSEDLTIYKKNQNDMMHKSMFANYESENLNVRQGVVNILTGRILVPIMFSRVVTSSEKEPFSLDEYPICNQLSIVTLDTFCKGKKSYYGLFINDQLVLPIGFEEISRVQYCEYDKETKRSWKINTNYLMIKQNNLYGIYDSWGREILPVEAVSIRLLSPEHESNYILAVDEEDYIKVIYKNHVISDYCYTYARAINPSEFKMGALTDEQLVELRSEDGGITMMFKGEIIVNFDCGDVAVFGCNIQKETTDNNFVFLVNQGDFKGVFDSSGKELIPFGEYNAIEIRSSFISVDGIIYGENMAQIADLNGAELLNSVHNYNGSVRVYYTRDEKYAIISFDSWCVAIDIINREDIDEHSEQYYDWKYNFEENRFEYISDEEERYSDYTDDTDYDRDTYYALGGDDYDAFKERGGSIDDMMNYMGY